MDEMLCNSSRLIILDYYYSNETKILNERRNETDDGINLFICFSSRHVCNHIDSNIYKSVMPRVCCAPDSKTAKSPNIFMLVSSPLLNRTTVKRFASIRRVRIGTILSHDHKSTGASTVLR
ncbi:hypothetical protein P152DRAFT_43495 [Eremomyces bilateralis CBS 781.70]|uniref:Uncharacterized protein n=1 Tax=Eremomyces bilateralis CBS 781.70 TaxID=1392243 RepID=A0A6G1G1R7_9PEZI|nr:uncharacterized protein P152DRAFT_43495 [Eremomyces bilateralis CBS 781.70]KAF1812055.1 hypothetical protein P152DRAFT_43495 [Eremomyces bilateralis CBS 781.70]